MNRFFTYRIDEASSGLTIGQFLKQRGFSKPIIIHLKKTPESILLNNVWSYVNTRLSLHDTLEIKLLETECSENIPATSIALEQFREMIVYEDDDILVMNKPAGLPVHPSMGHHEDTLANYCAYYYSLQPENGAFVFRCVNRLDRDTSGLVLIAKNMISSAKLSTQQLNREIHRTYRAIVTGITLEQGTINLPIARKDDSVIERCIDIERGETAVTHYTRIATANYLGSNDITQECSPHPASSTEQYSLLEIHLETGRTHQIRVHMKAIGHPLPGDFLYNPDFRRIKRQALHSYRLEFTHPITNEALCFTQEPPTDFHFVPYHSCS